ncbi:MAG: DUF4416 family protein [Nanoarchaeota archaeon]|nr:DUF4416 family protein [Nanoarchaeota archaeon]MBU1704988.1 DUF4416 family protein [Nanoarchaeota archaeon]
MDRLLIAVMYPDEENLDKVKSDLVKEYGLIIKESEPYDFTTFTSYYEPEMGAKILKRFLIFEKKISKNDMIEIKKKITEFEKKYSVDGKRTINLDPGYISSTELVLATCKGKGFKEKLGDKVWAHKVLEFKDGEAIAFYHTFADYKKFKDWFVDFQ